MDAQPPPAAAAAAAEAPVGEVPSNANQHCPGTESSDAGKSDACAGCPNQQICATAPKGPDPDVAAIGARLSSVRHIILVLSGKGGVGKSTFASQLAWGLVASGKQVGILDVDICGPSIPRLMGLEGEEIHQSASGWSPVYVHDSLAVMSIGFMLPDPDDAVVWRGPRKNSLIKQFLRDVDWGDLDYLVIDTPPGTSDEHISMAQYLKEAPVEGAIVITTPQEVSLMDVRKEINFCRKVGLPVIGVVENMSHLEVPISAMRFVVAGSMEAKQQQKEEQQQQEQNDGDGNSEYNGDVDSTGVDVTEQVMAALRTALPHLFPTPTTSTSGAASVNGTSSETVHAGSVSIHVEAPLFHVDANGGAEHMARKVGVTFLGRLPFDPQLGRAAEEGRSLLPISPLETAANGDEMNVGEGIVDGIVGSEGVGGKAGPSASSRCLKELIGKITSIVEKRKRDREAA